MMESFTDYYAILGVSRGASSEEIRNAFRAGAIKFHPDRNTAPDATTRFIEMQKAFAVLNDPEHRKRYDILYELHMQGAMLPPLSRKRIETASVVSSKPERDPISITMDFKKGQSAHFVLENIPYSLSSDQVKSLMRDGMIRVRSLEEDEYLLMYCGYCHTFFMSRRNRDGLGLLYFPYDLFPLCPHCDAPNWCPVNNIWERRKREAEERREQVARDRLKSWREQDQQQRIEAAELQGSERRENRKRVGQDQEERRKVRVRMGTIHSCAIGAAIALMGMLLSAVLLLLLAQSPTIVDLRLVHPGLLAHGNIEVAFDYRPGNMPGLIEAQFSSEGEVIDVQKLDMKGAKAGSRLISSRILPGSYSGSGTVALFWCPYYDCAYAQSMGALEFATPGL